MRNAEYGPAPWTQQQLRFSSARYPVRILKGHPGSGKTTALHHAADECGARRVLYLTYSRELAVLASEYFERYCSSARLFHVLTLDAFLRRLAIEGVPAVGYAEPHSRLRGALAPFARSLGPWADRTGALYDEWHAHLVGAALPVGIGRFEACEQPRTPGRSEKPGGRYRVLVPRGPGLRWGTTPQAGRNPVESVPFWPNPPVARPW